MKAYLTVDDISTKRSRIISDFLFSKNIKAIMFVWGQRAEEYYDNSVYAITKGMILENHSYSHPFFSKLSLEKAKEEILKNEKLIEDFYLKAQKERPFKAFRFPYGDTGGLLKKEIDDFLMQDGFKPLKKSRMALEKIHHVLWDFDFEEYKVRKKSKTSFDEIYKKAQNFIDEWKKSPEKYKDFIPVILIHDHTETEEMQKNYFEKLINLFLENGIEFIEPEV